MNRPFAAGCKIGFPAPVARTPVARTTPRVARTTRLSVLRQQPQAAKRLRRPANKLSGLTREGPLPNIDARGRVGGSHGMLARQNSIDTGRELVVRGRCRPVFPEQPERLVSRSGAQS